MLEKSGVTRIGRRMLVLLFIFASASACQNQSAHTDYSVVYTLDNRTPSAQPAGADAAAKIKYKIGIVPKVAGIPYFNVAEDGAREAAGDLNVEVIYEGPPIADAEQQIHVIEDLIDKRVNLIAVSANDPDKLVPVLQKAKSRGIKIITWDADTKPQAREFFVNMVEPQTLGRHLLDTLAWNMGEKGKFAILTGALSASNLNEWIKWIKIQRQEFYPRMELADIAASDDNPQKAYEAAKQLLADHPDLKGIIGNSSVGPPAAARAVKEAGKAGQITVVGLSTPNLMRPFLHDGSAQMATLWSPKKLGYLTVALAKNLLDGHQPVSGQEIYNVGNIRLIGDMVIMGEPLDFTKENVDQYDF